MRIQPIATSKTKSTSKGTLRDRLLEEGLPKKEYFDNKNHKYSEGLGIKSESKGQKVVKNLELTEKQSEDLVKKICVAWLKSQGWEPHTIYTGGIPLGGSGLSANRLGTNPSKGIPDCIAFNLKKHKVIWIEWKKSHGGIVSQEQLNWHSWLKTCGCEVYVVNSLSSLKEQLNNGPT